MAIAGKTILVPLTSSLYVPGTMTMTDKVIVDVGTGFYVEKVGFSIVIS
jgi:prefoldin alpha subunit